MDETAATDLRRPDALCERDEDGNKSVERHGHDEVDLFIIAPCFNELPAQNEDCGATYNVRTGGRGAASRP